MDNSVIRSSNVNITLWLPLTVNITLCLYCAPVSLAKVVKNYMITINCKYNSVLILRAGQLGELVKYTSWLEGNKLVSNQMNLIHNSYKYCCKYNRVVLSSFGQTNQLTIGYVLICAQHSFLSSWSIIFATRKIQV